MSIIYYNFFNKISIYKNLQNISKRYKIFKVKIRIMILEIK